MPYDYPFRLRVLMALCDALKQITPANGYVSDMSTSVFRGRKWFGTNDPLPMLSVLEDIEQNQMEVEQDNTDSGLFKGPYPLIIQGFVQEDPVNPTDPSHVLSADTTKRLATLMDASRDGCPFPSLPSVYGMRIRRPIVRPPDEISNEAHFILRVVLDIAEDLTSPYDDA